MDTIKLPDGYNGDMVECEREPIEVDGDMLKLRVKDSYLVRWVTRKEWQAAVDKFDDEYAAESYRELDRLFPNG